MIPSEYAKGIFRSHFFPYVYPIVRMYVHKFCEIQFFFEKLAIYGVQVNRKWTGSEPEVGRKWNARDLQVQGACALQFLV